MGSKAASYLRAACQLSPAADRRSEKAMCEKCQELTYAVQQTLLFDHLVRAKHEAGRDLMPDCLGRL
jgi:hypothetical protein